MLLLNTWQVLLLVAGILAIFVTSEYLAGVAVGGHCIFASCVTSEYLAGVAVGGHGIPASCVTSEYLAGVAVGCWYPGHLCYL